MFTGLSWPQGSFVSGSGFTLPMKWFPGHHSISQKTFLGITIPASATENGPGDLKIALDTLFNHPNIGPFIATRLIQQMVTSNPSPAYVSRVAAVFNDNGSGVRGDMAAVIKAILLDDEARNTAAAQANPNYGKLRQPLIRMANWVRAFDDQVEERLLRCRGPVQQLRVRPRPERRARSAVGVQLLAAALHPAAHHAREPAAFRRRNSKSSTS